MLTCVPYSPATNTSYLPPAPGFPAHHHQNNATGGRGCCWGAAVCTSRDLGSQPGSAMCCVIFGKSLSFSAEQKQYSRDCLFYSVILLEDSVEIMIVKVVLKYRALRIYKFVLLNSALLSRSVRKKGKTSDPAGSTSPFVTLAHEANTSLAYSIALHSPLQRRVAKFKSRVLAGNN